MSAGEHGPMGRRPRTIREILEAAFRLVRAHWRPLGIAVLFGVVPMQVLGVVVTALTLPGGAGDDARIAESAAGGGELGIFGAGVVVVSLLNALTVLLGTAACLKAIADACLGRRPTWQASARYALQRFLPVLVLSVVYGIGVLAGLLALVVPGILLACIWALAYPALLVEGQGVLGALKRPLRLMAGRWWPTLAVVLAAFVLVVIISSLVQLAVLAPSLLVDSLAVYFVLSAVAGIVAYAVATPLAAAIITLTYFDLRIRQEGLDLQQLAELPAHSAPGARRPSAGGPGAAPPSSGS